MTECPFKVGDLVRAKPGYKLNLKRRKGRVVKIEELISLRTNEKSWLVTIDRDNMDNVVRGRARLKARYHFFVYPGELCHFEVCGPSDLNQYEAAKELARAVLAAESMADLVAARALVDRLTDLFSEM